MKPHHRYEEPSDTEIVAKKSRKGLIALLSTLAGVVLAVPICLGWVQTAFEVVKTPETLKVQEGQISTIEKHDQGTDEEIKLLQVENANLSQQLQEIKAVVTRTEDRLERMYHYSQPQLNNKGNNNP